MNQSQQTYFQKGKSNHKKRKRGVRTSNYTESDAHTHNHNETPKSKPQATPSFASFPPISQMISTIHPNFQQLSLSHPIFAREWDNLRTRQKASRSKSSPKKQQERESSTSNPEDTKHNHPADSSTSSNALNAHVDFDFNLALSRAILDIHFRLQLPNMPRGYLCPPIPNRFNYVLWIKELLKELKSRTYFQEPAELVHRGADLGVGVSCIYPLLLSTNQFTDGRAWRFFGTDIDPCSVQCAQENVNANDLQGVIQLALVSPRSSTLKSVPACIDKVSVNQTTSPTPIHDDDDDDDVSDTVNLSTPLKSAMTAATKLYDEEKDEKEARVMFDFCMSNPPFYSNPNEASAPRSGDGRARTDMTFHESVYPGGELGFALDLLRDSVRFRNRITWYTLMLSKKSNLIVFEKELAKAGLHRGSVRTTEFVQGKMMRWGIAWTFLTPSIRSPALRLVGGVDSFIVTLDTGSDENKSLREVFDRFHSFCNDLKMADLSCEQVSENHLMMTEKGLKDDVTSTSSSCKNRLLLDAFVECEVSTAVSIVNVRLESFASSVEGLEMVRKIQRQLHGEIGRTNRRWRRLMKHQS